jgi:hypothetical protein
MKQSNTNTMNYSEKQIENAKYSYNKMMVLKSINDYEVNVIGVNEAERRMEYHNNIVTDIRNGNKELEREWKLFFLTEEVKKDQKAEASKAKLIANKEASADILKPVKDLKKLGEFGKWLNVSGNKYRSQHFNKKYTQEAVNAFLQTL